MDRQAGSSSEDAALSLTSPTTQFALFKSGQDPVARCLSIACRPDSAYAQQGAKFACDLAKRLEYAQQHVESSVGYAMSVARARTRRCRSHGANLGLGSLRTIARARPGKGLLRRQDRAGGSGRFAV